MTHEIVLCRCCKLHPADRSEINFERTVDCIECGEPCSCEGCLADAWEAAERKLDIERQSSLEGGE